MSDAPPFVLYMVLGQLPSGEFDYVCCQKKETGILMLKERCSKIKNFQFHEYRYHGFVLENE